MADPRDVKGPDIPDLIVPPRKVSTPRMEAPVLPRRPPADSGPELGALPIERNVTQPGSVPPSGPRKEVVISLVDDDFDMQIERTGSTMTGQTSTSQRPRAEVTGVTGVTGSGRPATSGLDVAYKRSDLERAERAPRGPSAGEIALAWGASMVVCGGAFGALLKVAHRHGGAALTKLLPRAFDASSAIASGGVALGAFASVIVLAYTGLKWKPRSYALLVASGALLLTSLAMVTVALVATDEHPTTPDGALVIPYLVPLALLCAGLGLLRHGISLFLRRGTARALALLLAALGGLLAFGAVEGSRLATLLR